MGRFITFYTAIHHPELKAIVSIGGPVYVKSILKYLVSITKPFKKYVKSIGGDKMDVLDPAFQKDPIFLELHKQYEMVVLKAVASELKIMKIIRKNLHKITQPILICQGRNDKTVPADTPDYIYERVSSEEKSIKWYEKSAHYVQLDFDCKQLFADVTSFFKKHI